MILLLIIINMFNTLLLLNNYMQFVKTMIVINMFNTLLLLNDYMRFVKTMVVISGGTNNFSISLPGLSQDFRKFYFFS